MIAAATKAAAVRSKNRPSVMSGIGKNLPPPITGMDRKHREDIQSEPMNDVDRSVSPSSEANSISLSHDSYASKEYIRASISYRMDQFSQIYNSELPRQYEIRKLYDGPFIQIAVAVLIFLNFMVSAAASQYGTSPPGAFLVFDLIFTMTFTIELFMNMYAHWLWDFWNSNWNIFDFVIVFISLLSISVSNSTNIPGLTVLRLFRAFRVFRLFKRVESLRLIIEGVIRSLPGVFNAFGILVLLMGIWSIMGVELFSERDANFATFGDAMLVMFQILTLDGWMELLERLMNRCGPLWPLVFFVSYIFIASIVMINVVIAVLIENFLSRDDGEERHEDETFEDINYAIDSRLSRTKYLNCKTQVKVSHCEMPQEASALKSKRDNIIMILRKIKLAPKDLVALNVLQEIEDMAMTLEENAVDFKEVKDFLGTVENEHT